MSEWMNEIPIWKHWLSQTIHLRFLITGTVAGSLWANKSSYSRAEISLLVSTRWLFWTALVVTVKVKAPGFPINKMKEIRNQNKNWKWKFKMKIKKWIPFLPLFLNLVWCPSGEIK